MDRSNLYGSRFIAGLRHGFARRWRTPVIGTAPGVSGRTATISTAITAIRAGAISARHSRPRFGVVTQTALTRMFEDLALIHPSLYTNYAVGRMSLGKTIVDIRSQCMQRQLPMQIPLRTRDFGTV